MLFLLQLSFILLAFVFLILSIHVVREDCRIIIYRFGRFFKISGPGIVIVIPFIDKITKVNLAEEIPDRQTLSINILNEKIKHIALYKRREG